MKSIIYFAKKIHSASGKILYLNLFGMVFISLFEGVGLFLLIPLLSLTGIIHFPIDENSPLILLHQLFDRIPGDISLVVILLFYTLLMLLQAFFQRYQIILNGKIKQEFIRSLREETYKVLMKAKWRFFLNKRKTDIINTITTEISRVASGTHLFLQFIASFVFTFIQICLALWLSAQLTIAVLLFGFGLIYISRYFIYKSNKIGHQTIGLSKEYLGGITDHLNGIKDIKSNSLELPHINWVKSMGLRIEHNVMESTKLKATSQLIFKVVSSFLIAAFVFFSIKIFHAHLAQLILIIMIFSRLWPRVRGIQDNLERLGSYLPSFHSVIRLQEECQDMKELDEGIYSNVEPTRIRKGLECKNIFFRYNKETTEYTLEGINIEIPANHMTAIVGPSGAGKSTLIDILMGLNQPESGEILVDGTPLTSENLLSLRRSVSYVPQDPFLFNASIRENLLMIEPNANEERIWEALEFSSAAEFIKKLPHGLDTLIGDRGIRLSGGERQRIVLARAILRQPSILVLDEATSALDTENEAKIQSALERLKGTMTIIIIAHRLSTIRNADQVIVLDQGRIVQTGGFNQLANEKRGLFRHLLGNQQQLAIRE